MNFFRKASQTTHHTVRKLCTAIRSPLTFYWKVFAGIDRGRPIKLMVLTFFIFYKSNNFILSFALLERALFASPAKFQTAKKGNKLVGIL